MFGMSGQIQSGSIPTATLKFTLWKFDALTRAATFSKHAHDVTKGLFETPT